MRRHEAATESAPLSIEGKTPAAASLLKHADLLARWCESALESVRAHPKQFGDIDVAGIEFGVTFLRRRLIPHVATGGTLPPVAILCGGTNTGKSTLVNTIAGYIVSPSGCTASFTKRLVGAGREEDLKAVTAAHAGFHLVPTSELSNPSPRRHALYADHDPDWPCDLPIVLDTPDIDSSDPKCREATRLGLGFADLVVWVTTQQKYEDERGISFLDEAMLLLPRRIDVFNQYHPQHAGALDDLTRRYGERWPDHKRAVLAIPMQEMTGNGALPKESVKELRRHLADSAAEASGRRIESLEHGLGNTETALTGSARHLLARQDECEEMIHEFRQRIERSLKQPIREFAGHAGYFELQDALVRVLQPRLKTSFGDLVSDISRKAGDAYSMLRSTLFGSSPKQGPVDPIAERDRRDLEETAKLIETARADLLERSRDAAQSGKPLAIRLHDELRLLDWPDPAALRDRLREHLTERGRTQMQPVIDKFEHDLADFCDGNPEVIATMRAVIPGFSALTGFAAAVIAIKTAVILPGVTEYLLGPIGLPVYERLAGWLPANLLHFVDKLSLSREPFMSRTYDAFEKTRRAIFLEPVDWLTRPVETLFLPVALDRGDVPLLLEQIRTDWESVRTEWGATSTRSS